MRNLLLASLLALASLTASSTARAEGYLPQFRAYTLEWTPQAPAGGVTLLPYDMLEGRFIVIGEGDDLFILRADIRVSPITGIGGLMLVLAGIVGDSTDLAEIGTNIAFGGGYKTYTGMTVGPQLNFGGLQIGVVGELEFGAMSAPNGQFVLGGLAGGALALDVTMIENVYVGLEVGVLAALPAVQGQPIWPRHYTRLIGSYVLDGNALDFAFGAFFTLGYFVDFFPAIGTTEESLGGGPLLSVGVTF